jgi:hypothetical protein
MRGEHPVSDPGVHCLWPGVMRLRPEQIEEWTFAVRRPRIVG